MLHREILSSATETGLNFVGNEKDLVLITEVAQRAQEFKRSDVEAALALNGFDDDGRDV